MIWENRVQLKLNEYANCMLNVWNEVNTLHVNADVEVNELLHIMLGMEIMAAFYVKELFSESSSRANATKGFVSYS